MIDALRQRKSILKPRSSPHLRASRLPIWTGIQTCRLRAPTYRSV